MRRAVALARRGAGRVEPNPMVGCVIVRGGRIIAEGWHRRYGGAHAEIDALRRCGPAARGATVYVTLEPCNHHGKTPPCARALIDAGVARVVCGTADPNPAVRGGGLAALRRAGVVVQTGVCGELCRALIAPFAKRVTTGRPWVIAKWAQSLDGCIATRSGDARWVSGPAARAHVHRVRGRLDAIVAGIGTVLHDDPLLTCRVGAVRRVATRVVLDSNLRTPLRSQLVRTSAAAPVWICGSAGAPRSRALRLERAGCRVLRLPARRAGLDLRRLLDEMGSAGMTNVLFEGGGTVLGSALDGGLADELHVYIAPVLLGGRQAVRALAGVGPRSMADGTRFAAVPELRRIGEDWFLRALVARRRLVRGPVS